MRKIGLLLSGQGSEVAGMGLDLYEAEPLFKATIDAAAQVTALDLKEILGDATLLSQTRYAQPAIVAFSVGLTRLMAQYDLMVTGALGLSLGEYSALIGSGMLPFETGMRLVARRGELMQATTDQHPGAMLAVLQPNVPLIQRICQTVVQSGQTVAIANYNSPQQVVVGGTSAGIAIVKHEIETHQAAKRVITLPVKSAFHTDLFTTTAAQFEAAVAAIDYQAGQYPVISNTTVAAFEPQSIREVLVQQMFQPTHFGEGLLSLQAHGIDTVLELGPGKTLSRFAKQVAPELDRFQVDRVTSLETTLVKLKEDSK